MEVDPITHRVYVANNDKTVSVIAPFASEEITFTSTPPTQARVGGSHTVTATGGASGNPVTFSTSGPACTVTPGGQVDFTLDGAAVGSAVQLAPDGTAISPELTGSSLAVGAHQVGADFTPTDENRYAGSSATAQTLTVSEAATTAGVPTGTVRFSLAGTEIGSASLAGGTATLSHRVRTGGTRQVSAVYAGDAAFTGSSASTARRDPVVTSTLASARAPRRSWYARTGGPWA